MNLALGPAWSRVTRMGWDELRTRTQQEFTKRLDAARYRFGMAPPRVAPQRSRSSQFFFSHSELCERARLLRTYLPAEVAALLGDADNICRHRFVLLGYTDLQYGPEIDWHLDVVHGKRAPLKPWFKIDYLNSAKVGDHKIIWELNRHQHLVTLAKAWVLSGEERYAREVISQWYAWQRANPYPIGINWVSSLEIAFRTLSWIWVQHLLAGFRGLTTSFRDDLLQATALNGRHIEQYLSTYFSPNTHLLGEAVALFFVGVLCPEIPASSGWREDGLQIVLEQARSQVREDGVYFEQSLYYHVYALDFFLHTRLLAERNHIEIPASFDQVIRKMLAVLDALSQNGCPDGFGDDDGGRVFNPRRSRAEHMTDPLPIGSLLFGSEQAPSGAALTEEAVWLFGERAAALPQQRLSLLPGHSQCFREGGIYVSFSPSGSSEQIIIDAGPQGALRCGHGHADALSVKLSWDGHPYLIDPGTFSYMSTGIERNLFRGTGAHNTLRVDGLDQASPQGAFAWTDVPSVHRESWIAGDTFTFFSALHKGYSRLSDPVVHRRLVVHFYGNFILVRDVAEGNAEHELEIFWHFAPNLEVCRIGNCFIAAGQEGRSKKLALVPVDDPRWSYEIVSSHVSPVYGSALPAQVLRASAKLGLPTSHAMVVHFGQQQNNAGELVSATQSTSAGATVYEYRENQRSHFVIFADPRAKDWEFGELTSDARFLYYCTEGQRISQFIACEVSSVRRRGERLVCCRGKVERLEYCDQDGKRWVSSSDSELWSSFQENALESWKAGVVG